MCKSTRLYVFFFNDTATTEIYTLSLHDALPISRRIHPGQRRKLYPFCSSHPRGARGLRRIRALRSEEHTSELQSPCNLVCRLLLEKKKSWMASQLASTSVSTWLQSPTTVWNSLR